MWPVIVAAFHVVLSNAHTLQKFQTTIDSEGSTQTEPGIEQKSSLRTEEVAKTTVRPTARKHDSQPPRHPIQVRLGFLQPTSDTQSLLNVYLPFLRNALCWAEKNLARPLHEHSYFNSVPQYIIYTDNITDHYAQEVMRVFSPARYQTINLDRDPLDRARMVSFNSTILDDKNLASVRRTLADADHLNSSMGRLLIGSDVKFLGTPVDFLDQAAQLPNGQALYMVDRFWTGIMPNGEPASKAKYKMNYAGPQCPGLLGDFIYMSPGVKTTVKNLREKMIWYANQPRNPSRCIPACPPATSLSKGLHAIDQFALSMALGEAVSPQGEKGCFSLDTDKYSHWLPRTAQTVVSHDKQMDACILVSPWDQRAKHNALASSKYARRTTSYVMGLLLVIAAVLVVFSLWGEEVPDKRTPMKGLDHEGRWT